MKSICLAVLTTLAAASPALAHGSETAKPAVKRFKHDGYAYRYVDFQRDGARIIRGQREDGAKFRYAVRNGQVRGNIDGAPVQFGLDDVPSLSR